MKTEPNEPINPIVVTNYNHESGQSFIDDKYQGLTKREHFAGLAMQGLLACNATYDGKTIARSELAEDALGFADALISALNKALD